jgi:glycosyltransferase involved in cell wall biosynthesis
MKVIYCSFEKIFDPVFDSQVVLFLKEIKSRFDVNNESISIVNFGSVTDLFKSNYKQKKQEIRDSLKIKSVFSLKLPYSYKYPTLFKPLLLLNVFICVAVFAILLKIKKNEPLILHCRNHLVSYIFLIVKKFFYKNIRVICDCRGLGSQEVLLKFNFSLKRKTALSAVMESIEKYVYLNADHLFCVSNTFREIIAKAIEPQKREISVIPCCIEVERFLYNVDLRNKIRAELGVSNNFALLYSGSMDAWQLFPETARIFSIFKKIIKNSIFIIFTKESEKAQMLLLELGIAREDYILRSIPHNNINRYLLSGDLGMLIREDNLVNKVAFPVKFSEYVACGVPVLSSIRSDVIELIEDHDLGFKLSDFENEKEIEGIAAVILSRIEYITGNDYKNRISAIIRDKMGWSYYIDDIMSVYEKLFGKCVIMGN